MTRNLLRPPAAPLFVFIAAALAGWLNMSGPGAEGRRPQAVLKSSEDVGQSDLVLKPAVLEPTSVVAIAEHPLLAKGRKPIAPESSFESDPALESEIETVTEAQEPAQESISEPPPEVRLLGVMTSAASAKALLRNQYDESEQWLAVGETIQGWALVEITQSKVVLRAGANEISIQMFE